MTLPHGKTAELEDIIFGHFNVVQQVVKVESFFGVVVQPVNLQRLYLFAIP